MLDAQKMYYSLASVSAEAFLSIAQNRARGNERNHHCGELCKGLVVEMGALQCHFYDDGSLYGLRDQSCPAWLAFVQRANNAVMVTVGLFLRQCPLFLTFNFLLSLLAFSARIG